MRFVKPGRGAEGFTLIHISDFHICSPSGSAPTLFLNKRLLSFLNWRLRRRHEHRLDILLALVEAVRSAAADQIVVTGDLTQLGLPCEFDQAREILRSIGPAQQVFVVPGNHDAMVPSAWSKTFARWGEFMAPDAGAVCGPSAFPTLRTRGNVALIGLSTATPTRPLSAAGSLGERQLQKLSELLDATERMNLFRVLLIHHPPVPELLSFHKRLLDADAFGAVLRQRGAELILHGHAHRCSCAEIDGPRSRIPVLGVSSASASSQKNDQRAVFRSIRISGEPGGWSTWVQDHSFSEKTGCFITSTSESSLPAADR
jgi:3',5'-cyclic AMP phosphodiesterase CpdA